jgi:hypothetical protein
MRNEVGRERSPAIGRDVSALSMFDVLENVLTYRYLFLSILLSGLLLGCVYVLFATPMYSANALIQIEDKKSSALGSLSTVTKSLDVEGSPILGEIDVARSRTVVTQAVEATAAQTTVTVKNTFPLFGRWLATVLPRDPDGLASAPFGATRWAWGGENLTLGSFDVPAAQIGKQNKLVYQGDGKWTLQDRNGDELLSGTVGVLAVSGGAGRPDHQEAQRCRDQAGVRRFRAGIQRRQPVLRRSARQRDCRRVRGEQHHAPRPGVGTQPQLPEHPDPDCAHPAATGGRRTQFVSQSRRQH